MYLLDLAPFLDKVVTLVKLNYLHEKLPGA
jgi:hypothetical protein